MERRGVLALLGVGVAGTPLIDGVVKSGKPEFVKTVLDLSDRVVTVPPRHDSAEYKWHTVGYAWVEDGLSGRWVKVEP